MTSDDPATVFLTGSSGLVGSALRRRFDSAGLQVIPIARGHGIEAGLRPKTAHVVHAAWPAGDAASWATFRAWSMQLRKGAAARGHWFIGLGSGVEACAADPNLQEPYKSYVQRKLELRDALAEVDPSHFIWIRLHFMFGPGERPSRLVPAAIRASLAGEPFVCGSLDRRRRWLHVDDQAGYLADFLKSPRAGEWDIAGRRDVSFRDLLTLIERATCRELRVRITDELAPDSGLLNIAPERMAPVVPAKAGDLDSLYGRLREYVAKVAGGSTKS